MTDTTEDTTDDTIPMDDEDLDHFCWLLVAEADNWLPFEETVEQCIDGGRDEEYERGYHAGSLLLAQHLVEHLSWYGVDVLERAQRHDKESEMDLPPFCDETIEYVEEAIADD
jgi:hypothetical protein